MQTTDIQQEIVRRNEVRREAKLPLLDECEFQRLQKVNEEAEFERYFESKRYLFSPLWSDRSRGYLSNMGIYAIVKRRLRDEMLKASAGDLRVTDT